MSKENEVKYNAPDLSKYEKEFEKIKADEANRSAGSGSSFAGDVYWYQWKEGTNNIFMLPPWEGSTELFMKVFKMWEIPPDKETHQCIELTHPELGIKCPVYTEMKSQQVRGHDMDEYLPEDRIYCNIIDIDGEVVHESYDTTDKNDKVTHHEEDVDMRITPQVATVPPSLYKQFLAYMFNAMTAGYENPMNAIPLSVTKTKKKSFTEYKLDYNKKIGKGSTKADRMPIYVDDNDQADEKIISQILKEMVNLKLLFRPPLHLLAVKGVDGATEDGKITECAKKLKIHFDNMKPKEIVAPGLKKINENLDKAVDDAASNGSKIASDIKKEVESTTNKNRVVNPDIEKSNTQKSGEALDEKELLKKIEETHVKETKVESNIVSTKVKKYPNAPDCYGNFGTPIEGKECKLCMFKVICKSDFEKGVK